MKLIREMKRFQQEHLQNVCVALGNFDGVHLGHKKLVAEMTARAEEVDGTAVVVSFHPHPLKVVRPEAFPLLLTPTAVKAGLLEQYGAEVLLLLPFDTSFASISADDFIEKFLYRGLKAQSIFVGFNFSFGKNGQGTAEYLQEQGQALGIQVNILQPVTVDGETVSSSVIRKCYLQGDMEMARKLLGYAPVISGTVVTGDQRGRTIGFPTANLAPEDDQLIPANGVYLALCRCKSFELPAMVNVGIKPTFGGQETTIEAHILGFSGDVYHQPMTLHLLTRLRSEKRFNGIEELKRQIHIDIETGKSYFSRLEGQLPRIIAPISNHCS